MEFDSRCQGEHNVLEARKEDAYKLDHLESMRHVRIETVRMRTLDSIPTLVHIITYISSEIIVILHVHLVNR